MNTSTYRRIGELNVGDTFRLGTGEKLVVRDGGVDGFVLKEDIGSRGVKQVYNNIRSVVKFILAYRTKHEGNNFVLVCEDIKWSYTKDSAFI